MRGEFIVLYSGSSVVKRGIYVRPEIVARYVALSAAFLAQVLAYGDEYVKTMVFNKTPDQVFAAAERVARRNGITVSERNERNHTLHLQVNSTEGWRMNEMYSACSAVFVADPEPRAGKTKASLTVGCVKVPEKGYPPSSAIGHAWEAGFSERFFQLLKDELHI
jgi:hypothetical protein